MALKFLIDKLEDVSESLRDSYVKRDDGKYQLDVDGAVSKSKLDEFRNTNTQTKKDLDALKDKFKGIDPEKYNELVELERQSKEKKMLDDNDIEGLVEERTARMKAEYEDKINNLNESLESTNANLSKLIIDNQVTEAAVKAGIADTALVDIVSRARGQYQVIDGVAVAKNGENIIYGKDGETPLPISEWVDGVKTSAPHLFKPSEGSGALGGSDKTSKDTSNMSSTQKIAAGLEK